MKTVTAFVNKENYTAFICPYCQHTHRISVATLQGKKHSVVAKCICNERLKLKLNRYCEGSKEKNMKIVRFEDIEAWQLARKLTRKVYELTKKPRFASDFGLRGQIQDAAGSSMHNIAEGFDSETNPEFVRFLRYAKRSCTEVQSQLYVALDQQYITNTEFQDVYDHAGRTRAAIRRFIKYLLAYEQDQSKNATLNAEP